MLLNVKSPFSGGIWQTARAHHETEAAVNMLPVVLFVLKVLTWLFIFFIKGTFLPSADGPWPLRLVDAVTREVTPTSAVGEHAAAAGTLLKRNL